MYIICDSDNKSIQNTVHTEFSGKEFLYEVIMSHLPPHMKLYLMWGLPRLLFLINEPLYACQISHTTTVNNSKKKKNANVPQFCVKGTLQLLPGFQGLFQIHERIFCIFWLIYRLYGFFFFLLDPVFEKQVSVAVGQLGKRFPKIFKRSPEL